MIPVVLALAAGIELTAAAAQPAPLECAYTPRGGEMQTFADCAWKDEQGQIRLSSPHLARLQFDRYGLAGVYVAGWYYIARDGRSAAVTTFDNGPDPFSEGLARSPIGDKIGYIDRHLRMTIPAGFDGAFQFEHGLASVCLGCREIADGEHRSYAGGNWGCIDRHGRFATAPHPAAGYVTCAP